MDVAVACAQTPRVAFERKAEMRFVLVHGGFHGAWCWERVVPELNALGHEAVAIDLPGHGERRDEVATLANRRQAVLDVLQPGDVLVGHSGGGYEITLAADAAPEKVGHLIYLAAGLPIEGRPLIEASGGRPASGIDEGGRTQVLTDENRMIRLVRLDARGRMECFDYAATRDFFYHDCDEASARWAFDQLTAAPVEFIQEQISLPKFWKADLPRSYIICSQDRAAPRSFTEERARRLGVVPLEIDASHSPFLSRPRETAEVFAAATMTSPVGPLLPA
jgi:pimeloyl-ACP methyl ester carboxylesterase